LIRISKIRVLPIDEDVAGTRELNEEASERRVFRGSEGPVAVRTHGIIRADRFAYYGARFFAQAGQSLYLTALLIAAGSGASVALGLSSIMVATMVAPMLFGLAAGGLGDRLGPGRGYTLGAMARLTVIAAGLPVVGHSGWVWMVAFAYSTVSQLFSPSELALVPIIQKDAPARAHTLLVTLQYAGQATGALLVMPVLFVAGGVTAVLAGAAVVYVVVVGLTFVVSARTRGQEAEYRAPARQAFSFRETMTFFSREPRATYAVGLLSFMDMATKCAVIALPAYLVSELDLSRPGVAAIAVPGVVGALLGLFWVGRSFSLTDAPRLMRLTLAGTVVSVLALAALDQGLGLANLAWRASVIPHVEIGINSSILVAIPVALLLGICVAVAPVGARAVLSATAPHGQQARVFASQAMFTEFLIILPLLLAGVGTEFAGPRVTFGFVAAAGVVLFLVLEALTTPVPAPAPTLAPAPVDIA